MARRSALLVTGTLFLTGATAIYFVDGGTHRSRGIVAHPVTTTGSSNVSAVPATPTTATLKQVAAPPAGDLAGVRSSAPTGSTTAKAESRPIKSPTSTARVGHSRPAQLGAAQGSPSAAEGLQGRGSAAGSHAVQAGSYDEQTSGTLTTAYGTSNVGGASTLTAATAMGSSQRLTASSPGSSLMEKIVFTDDGALVADLNIASGPLTYDFVAPLPEPLLRLASGTSWSWTVTSTDGKEKLSVAGSTRGSEFVMIAGAQRYATVVETTLTFSGEQDVVMNTTDDYLPNYHLVVRDHATAKGTYRGVGFTADTTTTIKTLSPR